MKIYKMWKWFLRKKQSETIIKIAKKSLNPFKEITENLLVFWNEVKGEKALVLVTNHLKMTAAIFTLTGKSSTKTR